MAKHEPAAETPKTPVLKWDTETRDDLAKKEGHIRGDMMYLTSSLLTWMEDTWGGVVTHVKTSTDTVTGEVSVMKAEKHELGATYLRRIGTQNAGDFSFWRPLHKLSLKVPPHRQFNVTPFTREVPGVGTLFVFPLNDRVSVPRSRKEEKAAAEATGQSGTQAAPSEA